MYYFLLALIDIGFYIAENWKQLTFTALASGIGMILGKRLGSRLAVRQIMKMLGLEKKSKLEQKVDFLIDIEAGRGNVWSGNTETSKNEDQMSLKKLSSSLHKALSRKGKKNMSKFKSRKFWMAVISGGLVIANDGLGLGLDTNTVLAFAGIVMSFIFGEAYVDSKRTGGTSDVDTQHYGDSGPAV